MKQKIQHLLKIAEELPDTDNDSDLFGPKNKKSILVAYYSNLLTNLDDTLISLLSTVQLDDSPEQVYTVINKGGHPVRDYLILKSAGLT